MRRGRAEMVTSDAAAELRSGHAKGARRIQSNGMPGTASTVCDLPFNVNLTAATESLLASYMDKTLNSKTSRCGWTRLPVTIWTQTTPATCRAIGDGVALRVARRLP